MELKKPFRVYSRGVVQFIYSEVLLGEWLLSYGLSKGHITITYGSISKSGLAATRNAYSSFSLNNIRAWRINNPKPTWLRFEDSDLRIESPSGRIADQSLLIECIRAAENLQRKSAEAFRSRYSTGSKSKWHRGVTYRIVHTHNERKQNHAISLDADAPKIRPSRMRLPDYWDEVYRHKSSNWKSFRRSQYKESKPSARLRSKQAHGENSVLCLEDLAVFT